MPFSAANRHPGWTATDELLKPYPNQRMRVVFRGSRTRPADWIGFDQDQASEPGSAAPAPKRPHGQHHPQ